MSSKVVLRRAAARQDIEEAVQYYLSRAGERIAECFLAAMEEAAEDIASSPGMGSPRYSDIMSMPSLRFWPVRRFPYLIFYFERDDHIDVWRILHGASDIPAWLGEPGDA